MLRVADNHADVPGLVVTGTCYPFFSDQRTCLPLITVNNVIRHCLYANTLFTGLKDLCEGRVYVCMEGGGGRGLLLVPSCCSFIQPDPNSRHLDQQTISANFFLMLWWLWRRH